MDTTNLVRQLAKDPGLVFLQIIRNSPKPVRAQDIKQQVIDAGAKCPSGNRFRVGDVVRVGGS